MLMYVYISNLNKLYKCSVKKLIGKFVIFLIIKFFLLIFNNIIIELGLIIII